MITWGKCRGCTKVTASERRRRKGCQREWGKPWVMSWGQNRDTNWQVSSLRAGQTVGPSVQVASVELRSPGGYQMLLPADITTACSKMASRPSGPHPPDAWSDLLPSPARKSDPMSALPCDGQGLLSKFQAPSSSLCHPGSWPVSGLCSHRRGALVHLRHRCLNKAEHTHSSTCNNSLPSKSCLQEKRQQQQNENKKCNTDHRRIKSWERFGV